MSISNWEGRFRGVAMLNEKRLLTTAGYIDLNPLAADAELATVRRLPRTSQCVGTHFGDRARVAAAAAAHGRPWHRNALPQALTGLAIPEPQPRPPGLPIVVRAGAPSKAHRAGESPSPRLPKISFATPAYPDAPR